MILLAIDPASCTGYSLVELKWRYLPDNVTWKWDSADIYEYGFINVDLSSNFQGDHCLDLMDKIQKIIDKHEVEYIIIEDFFFSKKFANGSNVNGAFRTAIHILARQNNIEYSIINISAWKNFVAGRSSPTKDQKKMWGATCAKKIYIQDALWNNFSIKFPNHSISEKTGKPISFKYDIVDVVAISIYYCGLCCAIPIENITCSVEIPEDVVLNSTKSIYCYT